MTDHCFPRETRLRRQRDFEGVYRANVYAADAVLVVQARRNDLEYSRLGVSLSRKVGNAVLRNRWKRLVREAFRQERSNLPPGLDFVVRPRLGARPIAAPVRRSLVELASRVARRLRKERP